VRIKFGYKRIGEAWTNETTLYLIVQSLFPNTTILRHYRPAFLQGLELGLFIKELNIGIEYQGIQHFKPVAHWGGERAFRQLKARDKRKQELCKRVGIDIVYFTYKDDLTNELVLRRIKEKAKGL